MEIEIIKKVDRGHYDPWMPGQKLIIEDSAARKMIDDGVAKETNGLISNQLKMIRQAIKEEEE